MRGISFEEIVVSKIVSILKHSTREHQKIMLFLHKRYIWVVPFVETESEIFLKTIYPSRKYTKWYLRGRGRS